MPVPDENLSFLVQIMQVEMAFLAEIRMLAILKRIVQGNPLGVSEPASIAFSSPHSTLEHGQWIFILSDWLKGLILCEDVHVLEDYDVVAALKMAEEVRPSEDYPQTLYFGLAHFVNRVGVFSLHSILLEIVIGEGDDLVDLLMGGVSVVVEVVLDEAVGVGPMDGFFSLEASDQAVELADHFEKGLFSVAEILVHFFAVDAVIQTEADEWLSWW